MDQESKQFIEASFEKWTDIIKGEFDRANERFNGIDKRFDAIDSRFDSLEGRVDRAKEDIAETKAAVAVMQEDLSETKAVVVRIEHTLQDKMEGQEDAIVNLQKRTDRLETKVGLPHVLAA